MRFLAAPHCMKALRMGIYMHQRRLPRKGRGAGNKKTDSPKLEFVGGLNGTMFRSLKKPSSTRMDKSLLLSRTARKSRSERKGLYCTKGAKVAPLFRVAHFASFLCDYSFLNSITADSPPNNSASFSAAKLICPSLV